MCCTLHPCVSRSWCRLLHQKRIKALNVVIVEGMTQSHFYKHYLTLRHLRAKYTTVSRCDGKSDIHLVCILGLTSVVIFYLTGLEGHL